MKEIAYSAFGRNALVIGLISHVGALIIGMVPASGSGRLFFILYLVYVIVFFCAAYKELCGRGYRPFADAGFYMMMVGAVLPVCGPLIVLTMLYKRQGNIEPKQPQGFIRSFFKLRANMLLLFLFGIIVFILFVFLVMKDDPYFKRVKMKKAEIQNQQMEINRKHVLSLNQNYSETGKIYLWR
jgi:hypothetical protein